MKPSHYESKIDPLTYMKANMSQANYEGFLIGNVIKYVTRYPKKNGLEDLKKAADYLNKAIEMHEKDTKIDAGWMRTTFERADKQFEGEKL
ncbi:DUF3310 domain-containing protein [Shouchella lehensis]|uniref:DUF3310 domain-containing protein n=1 Tax=Shouchella lehensis G1 TaxID=1246626 RepID=A0A060LYY2_9BACI|nr:DUF3310 domain-containing protein [Shouchella lehensis]AIC95402.1 hypothetical protein BleG1_2838 [Shouchella lehensis G1]